MKKIGIVVGLLTVGCGVLSADAAFKMKLPPGKPPVARRVARSLDVPVLAVRGDAGVLGTVRMRYEWEASHRPLKVSVSDDQPLGTGDSFRSAIWIAAVTAAVARNNPMTGVQLDFDLTGCTDGPSAGAVLCLAILSALDGRMLPNDFAMTGTIMPDGTIGLVGGVEQKVRAAARGGKKRICIPLFHRFEVWSDGVCDLLGLAKELGVDVHPVANIAEAYAYVYGVDAPETFTGSVGEVLSCDENLDKALVALCRRFMDGLEKWRKFDKNLPAECGFDKTFHDGFWGEVSEAMFTAGFVAPACDSACRQIALWEAAEEFAKMRRKLLLERPVCAITNGFTRASRREYADMLMAMVRESEERIGKSESLLCKRNYVFKPDVPGVSNAAAQFEREGWIIAKATSRMLALEKASPTVEKVKAARETDDGSMDAKLVAWFRLEMLKRFMLIWQQKILVKEAKMRVTAMKAMPKVSVGRRVEQAESLFYMAWESVEKSLMAGTVSMIAEKRQVSVPQAFEMMFYNDDSLSTYVFDRNGVRRTHESLKPESGKTLPDRSYHAVATLCEDARVLASACAQLVKYESGQGLSQKIGCTSHSNMAFVNYLIRMARNRALRAMDECRRRGIPCPAAQMTFCSTEFVHGRPDYDLIDDVLARYWEAGLVAKALLMAGGIERRQK